MIAINIRGTGGSGKSTLVQNIMALYPDKVERHIEGRKRPIAYIRKGPGLTPLFVPGHYETACGGCDTVKTTDQVYDLVREGLQLGTGGNVLYEGIMVMDDVRRAVELDTWMRAWNLPAGRLHVIALTTPIEDCLAAIRDRRAARGDEKPLNEKNTRDRAKRMLSGLARLKDAGVVVEKMDRDAAFLRVRELLGV